MRILFVVNSLSCGGAEALITQLATGLLNVGLRVDVCTLYSKGQFADELERRGISVHFLGFDQGFKKYNPQHKFDLRYPLRLARLIDGNYDIVHVHLFPASLFVALVSFKVKQPSFIFSEHNVYNRRRRFPIYKILDWFIYSRYSKIVAVSDLVKRALLDWLPKLNGKVCVIPNAVNPGDYNVSKEKVKEVMNELKITQQDKVVFFAGRLVYQKGLDVLISASKDLVRSLNSIKVIIAGIGPLEESLRAEINSSYLKNHVMLLGLRKDIPILLNLSDVVVIPSRWEGLPMILIEAMAAKKTVIASKVGGIPEVIEHNVNGWLVPPENPSALADGIKYLLQSSEIHQRLGEQAAITVVERYSINAAVKKLIGVYQDAM